jgi:hypothetical protein
MFPLVFLIHVADEFFFLRFYYVYLEVAIDMEVSSGKDNMTKKSAGDDAGDGGTSSAEPIAPNPIRYNTSGQTDPSVADRAATTDPPISGRRNKRPPSIPKQKQVVPSADQAMIQIELPPCRIPCSLQDLVAIEINFGCLFEAFRCISQATGIGTLARDDIPPRKKLRQPPLKKILVLR